VATLLIKCLATWLNLRRQSFSSRRRLDLEQSSAACHIRAVTFRLLHSLEDMLLRTVLFIILLSCLRSDIVILDTLIAFTYLLIFHNLNKPEPIFVNFGTQYPDDPRLTWLIGIIAVATSWHAQTALLCLISISRDPVPTLRLHADVVQAACSLSWPCPSTSSSVFIIGSFAVDIPK